MTTDQLRKRYLDFFKSKGHQLFPSDSLIPSDDPSLLFTGAGMNQFKPYFLGLKKEVRRAASCQKCLRTADLDRVGKTAYHHSFFEMLGNFSFGDYFKEEAIAWGWEFVTKELGLPKEKLWVSVYEDDDEAFGIWKKKIGLPEPRIVRMGAVDNFWPSNAQIDGPNGPCGPCSEIYVGETPGKGVEIWNLVFTQFDRQSDGTLVDLPQKNIDTGMGLERTASVLQGVESNFNIDLFEQIRRNLKLLLKKDLGQIPHENAAMDHARAVVFSIADGASPSNEGRGYVIRKLIRLGADRLMKAGAQGGSFYQLVPTIVSVMGAAYPEIRSNEKNISAIIQNEEKSYLEVLRTQLPRLEADMLQIRKKERTLDSDRLTREAADLAFKYYDTYGVPLDTILDGIERSGVSLKKEGLNRCFQSLLDEQKKRSREASKIAGEIFSKNDALFLVESLPASEFLGYHQSESDAMLLRILKGDKKLSELKKGEEGFFIFDHSPFYAEAGGQVGDTGWVTSKGFKGKVLDAQWIEKCIVHKVLAEEGCAVIGEQYALRIDVQRRSDIMKNHTATHLLHSALRKILGGHVKQNGSLVAPDRLRFDFTHFGALDAKTLAAVEDLVNEEVQKGVLLEKKVMNKEAALQEGAVAFFGEKYGDAVRVINIEGFSKELCGGTHLESTREIGLFKILSESSIQAGVRRIEAVTGERAFDILEEREREKKGIGEMLGIPTESLLVGIGKAKARLANTKNHLGVLVAAKVQNRVLEIFKQAKEVKGVKIICSEINGADVELFQKAVEHLRTLGASFLALFGSETSGKVLFVVAASSALVSKGFESGKLIKAMASLVDGNGGGRPDFAVGGGKTTAKKAHAFELGQSEMRKFVESLG